jgi:hypothetical protein
MAAVKYERSVQYWSCVMQVSVIIEFRKFLQPFNVGIKFLRATLSAEIFYWGF